MPLSNHFYPVRSGYLEVKTNIEREISPLILLILISKFFNRKERCKNVNDGFSGETD